MSQDPDDDLARTMFYPSIFPVSVTHTEFPANYALFEESGLPFGAIITPFLDREDLPLSPQLTYADSASDVSRCSNCNAYMNYFVCSNGLHWTCSLCAHRNDISRSNHSRHRAQINKTGNLSPLEERECLLSDFPMPFRGIDNVPLSCQGKCALPAEQRPLVHIFLVQESMAPDALQAVIESIETVVRDCMHPDIQVILLSFSNRLGMYSLLSDVNASSSSSSASTSQFIPPGEDAASNYLPLPPQVRYMNLSLNNGRSNTHIHGSSLQTLKMDLAHIKSMQEGGTGLVNSLGMGIDMSMGGGEQSLSELEEIAPVCSMQSLSSMRNAALPVSKVRGKISEALSHLYDGWQSAIPTSGRIHGYGSTQEYYGSEHEKEHDEDHFASRPLSRSNAVPEVAVGPILEELARWICVRPSAHFATPTATSMSQHGNSSDVPSSVFGVSDHDMRTEIEEEMLAEQQFAETSRAGKNVHSSSGFFSNLGTSISRGIGLEQDDEEEDEDKVDGISSGGLWGLLGDISAAIISQTPINNNKNNSCNVPDNASTSFGSSYNNDSRCASGRLKKSKGGSTSSINSSEASTDEGTGTGREKGHEKERTRHDLDDLPAIDSCSGVVLHLFISSPQDLPPGWHASSPINSNYKYDTGAQSHRVGTSKSNHEFGVDMLWAEELGNQFALSQVAVNIWSVTSFESSELGLQGLYPLAQLTGGTVNRVVLGTYPRDERERLTELLRRSCASRAIATKGVLKLRTSPCIQVVNGSLSGHVAEDVDYPGVFRFGQCTQNASIGVQFEYVKRELALTDEKVKKVVIQMAFAYDTLVEGPEITAENEKLRAGHDGEGEEETCSVDPFSRNIRRIWGQDDQRDVNIALNKLHARRKAFLAEIKSGRYRSTLRTLSKLDVKTYLSSDIDIDIKSSSSSSASSSGIHRHAVRSGTNKFSHPSVANINTSQDVSAEKGALDRCYYDKRRRLVSVRRLRVFTCSLTCTSQPVSLMQCLDPSTLATLIARQALKDELAFRRQVIIMNRDYAGDASQMTISKLSSLSDSSDTFLGMQTCKALESGISSPGAQFIDSWAGSVLASGAASILLSSHHTNTRSPSEAVESALSFPALAKVLQLLYGTRVHLLAARTKAYSLASSEGLTKNRNILANRVIFGRIVTDDFMDFASVLLNSDALTCARVLFPQITPLRAAVVCRPDEVDAMMSTDDALQAHAHMNLTPQLEWFVGLQRVLLQRSSIVMDGSPAFLLDTGTHLVLYRSLTSISSSATSTGMSMKGQRQGDAPVPFDGAVFTGNPRHYIRSQAQAQEDASKQLEENKNETKTVQLHTVSAVPGIQSPEKIGSFQALNILSRLDRFVGRMTGESQYDESPAGSPSKSMNPTNKNDHVFTATSGLLSCGSRGPGGAIGAGADYESKGEWEDASQSQSPSKSQNNRKCDSDDDDDDDMEYESAASVTANSFARRLYKSSVWLPAELQRRLDNTSLVPKIVTADAGTASAAVLNRHLLLDIQDTGSMGGVEGEHSTSVSNQGLSYTSFIANAVRAAEVEAPDLFASIDR